MQYSNGFKTGFHLLGTLVIVCIIGFTSCSRKPSPDPAPPETPQPEANSFLFTSLVEAIHIKGSSPCPQKIADIQTFCGRSSDTCTADSVVITNPNIGLDAKFENGRQSTSLDSSPAESKILTILFNCQIPMSFDHNYKLVFYKNGVKVDEQSLGVKMTVQ